MFDPGFERVLSYRLSAVHDCWGNRRQVRCGTQSGTWFLDASCLTQAAPLDDGGDDPALARQQKLTEFQQSGRFSPTELATLHALVVERLTIAEIAERDGCSRQAVMARLVGNSRAQGGIVKKARALATSEVLSQ